MGEWPITKQKRYVQVVDSVKHPKWEHLSGKTKQKEDNLILFNDG